MPRRPSPHRSRTTSRRASPADLERRRPYHPRMDTVGGYLEALRAQDWEALRALFAPDVVRHGPYGDDFTDRDAYVAFLPEPFTLLGDYELAVHRSFGTTA